MKKLIALAAVILSSCNMGHKEVKYNEMITPPRVSHIKEGLLVKVTPSKEFPNFVIYEIQPIVDEGAKVILLKGRQARGRQPKNEFKLNLSYIREDSISAYKILWLDPDNRKIEVPIQKE